MDLRNFNTSKVTSMKRMFDRCTGLQSVDLSSFDTSSVTSMYMMFNNCNKLATIYAGNGWNVSNVTSSTDMFLGCTSLVGAIPFNSSYIDKTYATATGGYLTYKGN